jgi:hypothetical protein
MKTTVNLTVECDSPEQAHYFEAFVASQVTLKDYRIVSDTKELYDKDPVFRAISKGLKDAKKIRNDYINEHNDRYSQ